MKVVFLNKKGDVVGEITPVDIQITLGVRLTYQNRYYVVEEVDFDAGVATAKPA